MPPLADPGKQDRAAHGVPVVPAFDGYRAFAILAIVFLHLLFYSGVVTAAGSSLGGQLIWGSLPQFVDVLFIVSGFVVFLPTVAQNGRFGSVPAYAIRRAARLMPAFWLALAILIVLIAALAGAGALPSGPDAAVNFTGLQSIAAMVDTDFTVGFAINVPLWTLTLEISFYIVLPMIAASYFRHPWAGLAIAAAIAVLWRLAFANLGDIASTFGFHPSPDRLSELLFASGNQLPSWIFSFAAGMTGAWAYVRLTRDRDLETRERYGRRALAVALPLLFIFVYLAGRYAIDNPIPLPALVARQSALLDLGYTGSLATVMVALALAPRIWQLPFANRLARRLGDISYGVYLIHAVVIWVVAIEVSPPSDGSLGALVTWIALVLPVSLLYGYLSARFLEQPIRRWAHRFGRQAQTTASRTDQRRSRATTANPLPRSTTRSSKR